MSWFAPKRSYTVLVLRRTAEEWASNKPAIWQSVTLDARGFEAAARKAEAALHDGHPFSYAKVKRVTRNQ